MGSAGSRTISSSSLLILTSSLAKPSLLSSFSSSSFSGFHFLVPTKVGTMPTNIFRINIVLRLLSTKVEDGVPEAKLLEVHLRRGLGAGEVAVPVLRDLQVDLVLVKHPAPFIVIRFRLLG